MEENIATPTNTNTDQVRNLSRLEPVGRVLLTVILALVGALFAVGTVIIAITTVALVPAFLNVSINNPYGALLITVCSIAYNLLAASICALSFIFARRLFKRQTISRQAIILFVSLLILYFIINANFDTIVFQITGYPIP